VPVSELLPKCRLVRFERLPSSLGIVPFNPFCQKKRLDTDLPESA